jgi:hypothetical protein
VLEGASLPFAEDDSARVSGRDMLPADMRNSVQAGLLWRGSKGETMGVLVYAGSESYEIEDRALAHVKIAITSKLRRNESFLLNWSVPASAGSGRVSIWLSPAIPLQFRFSGSKPLELSRIWLEALERSSTGIRGMLLMNEEEAAHYLQAAGGATAP